MKQYLMLSVISLMIIGCSSGTKPASESETAAPAPDTAKVTETTENTDTAFSKDSSSASADTGDKFDQLYIGMKEKEVIELLGNPTARETISKDAKNEAEDWYYGDNKKVRIIRGEVNFVVKDVAHQKELLKQLMLAKKNNNEAEVKRLMDELTAGQK